MMEKEIDSISFPRDYSDDCSNCHNFFIKYKCLCVTCKAPCFNCTNRSVCNISTDTYDFEKYLESLTRKPKFQLKCKTVGTDTCDLDSHFDYYQSEKTSIIQKNVATDCADLNFRKLSSRRKSRRRENEVVDGVSEKKLPLNDEECEFAWNLKSEPRTYSRCSAVVKKPCPEIEIKPTEEPAKENLNLARDVLFKSDENKENYDATKHSDAEKIREIGFEDSSSDESDIDLVTSSKVSKCRKIARTHKLTLTQIETKNEKVFKCSICGKTFPKKYLSILHLGQHVDGDKSKCLICENNFSSLGLLTSHIQESHRGLGANHNDNILNEEDSEKCGEGDVIGKNTNLDNSTLLDKNYPAKQVDKGFQCVLCLNVNDTTSRFLSYKALYLHKRLKHGVKENKHRIKMERKPRLKREFICLFCGKEFKSNKALNDHLPVHTGEKNYLCDICNKSYTTNANLQIHKRTHMGLKNFKCTLCDKAFHKKDSLKVHFRKHSGERPFQCDLCPMRFDRNFILKNHRLRHFSEKTYICPVCGKAFTTHGGLNNHEKSHKRDPGSKKPRKPAVKPTLDTENAVICDVCGKVYSTRSNLRIHKFVHLGVKPFQCPVCQQSYAKKDSMLTHMRKHTDERPFSCETCGMAFYRNHTLKTHRLRHTGERPHKCHMCGKSFTQSSSLMYHIKHHSRKEEKKKIHLADDQNKSQRKKKLTGTKSLSLKTNAKDAKETEVSERPAEIMDDMVVMSDGNGLGYDDKNYPKNTTNAALMVPVIRKEVLVLDENSPVDTTDKKDNRSAEIFEPEKDSGQFGLGKFNYYITKNHVLPLPKDSFKPKVGYVKDEQNGKINPAGENLIISKNNCVATKDGNLLMTNRELWSKGVKGYLAELGENRTVSAAGVKTENVLPIAGEILNATFISDESGEVIPFGSMTLQSVNAENVMISPLIKIENDGSGDDGERRKALSRGSRLTVIDSKMKYHAASVGKNVAKANCQILNLKDPGMQQRIQLINPEPLSFHIQVPVSCTAVADDAVLNGIASNGTYYTNV